MANPGIIIKLAIKKEAKRSVASEGPILELISKAFTTRNLLHFAHWNTQSYASHMALGDLYDSIIEDIDDIVETYQGKYGLVEGLKCESASLPPDICDHVKEEAKWVEDNRTKISGGDTAIENLVDNLIASYYKATYKLENLH
jgi:hypothetical protein